MFIKISDITMDIVAVVSIMISYITGEIALFAGDEAIF